MSTSLVDLARPRVVHPEHTVRVVDFDVRTCHKLMGGIKHSLAKRGAVLLTHTPEKDCVRTRIS